MLVRSAAVRDFDQRRVHMANVEGQTEFLEAVVAFLAEGS